LGDLEPKKEYDAIIIGGGGHGLATAFYLAKKHNIRNIAVKDVYDYKNFSISIFINY